MTAIHLMGRETDQGLMPEWTYTYMPISTVTVLANAQHTPLPSAMIN